MPYCFKVYSSTWFSVRVNRDLDDGVSNGISEEGDKILWRGLLANAFGVRCYNGLRHWDTIMVFSAPHHLLWCLLYFYNSSSSEGAQYRKNCAFLCVHRNIDTVSEIWI